MAPLILNESTSSYGFLRLSINNGKTHFLINQEETHPMGHVSRPGPQLVPFPDSDRISFQSFPYHDTVQLDYATTANKTKQKN